MRSLKNLKKNLSLHRNLFLETENPCPFASMLRGLSAGFPFAHWKEFSTILKFVSHIQNSPFRLRHWIYGDLVSLGTVTEKISIRTQSSFPHFAGISIAHSFPGMWAMRRQSHHQLYISSSSISPLMEGGKIIFCKIFSRTSFLPASPRGPVS